MRAALYKHGWLAVKTHFFTRPGYRGPLLVRARSLAAGESIELGSKPDGSARLNFATDSPANAAAGWREFPAFTFVRAPGCYAWQLDGTTFSRTFVARVLEPHRL